jgi:transcriptional regulator with XRE-family HTH domain
VLVPVGKSRKKERGWRMPVVKDLDPGASPMHFFGAEVRRARLGAGMTLADLAVLVPCDASTVSRIEAGLLRPTGRFAAACDEAFPALGGWFARFYQGARKWKLPCPPWFQDWVVAEREAVTLRMWQLELVPGLLQTAGYARALFAAWQPAATGDELDDLVGGRLERQAVLDKAGPPELWVVMDEAVLHREIGSAKIMREQMEQLLEASDRPAVTIQVVPAGAGAHAGLLGAFAVAAGDNPPDTLYVDTAVQGQTVIDPAVVRRAGSMFDRLRAEALPRGASRELIERVMIQEWAR